VTKLKYLEGTAIIKVRRRSLEGVDEGVVMLFTSESSVFRLVLKNVKVTIQDGATIVL
jgi:hypothetical protein